MALSTEERAKVRLHLGYLNAQIGGAISLGIPSAQQVLFVLETTMNNLLPEAETMVRRAIAELDCILDQISAARSRLSASEVSNVKLRGPGELAELESQYQFWANHLSDIFGTPINPMSSLHQRLSGFVTVVEPV